MGDMVIVAFRPKPGCAELLDGLVRDHVPRLRSLGFATDRPALAMRAADGTLVEVFEWREGGIAEAHAHPEIQAMWARFDATSEHVVLASLAEAQGLFAQFVPLDP